MDISTKHFGDSENITAMGLGDLLLKVSFYTPTFTLITVGIYNLMIQVIICMHFLLMSDERTTRRPKEAESFAGKWTLENSSVKRTSVSLFVFGKQLERMNFALQISHLFGSHAQFKQASLSETAHTFWKRTTGKAKKTFVHQAVTSFFIFIGDFRYSTDKRIPSTIYIDSGSDKRLISFWITAVFSCLTHFLTVLRRE